LALGSLTVEIIIESIGYLFNLSIEWRIRWNTVETPKEYFDCFL